MSENPGAFPRIPSAARAAAASAVGAIQIPRSTQDVVFVDVGERKIDSNILRDGVPIVAHAIDTDVLNQVVIGEPVIAYRIVGQSVPAGTPVPLDTAIDVIMAQPGGLPVGVVKGVHAELAPLTVAAAYDKLIRGHPEAVRLVNRASEGPLSAVDEQTLTTLFAQAGAPISDTPGQDVSAALTTLQMLTTFGVP
jgi:hypothetical protein